MFRVPADPRNPTFDAVIKVGFWRWLTSSKAGRREWRRRRDLAARTAGANQRVRAQAAADAARARHAERKARRDDG